MKTITIYASTDSFAFVAGSSTDYSTARATATSHHKAIDPDTYFTETGIYKVMRSFLRFDTSVIPSGANIINAQMRLTAYEYSASRSFTVHIIAHDWSAYDPITATNRDDAYDGVLAGAFSAALNTFPAASTDSGTLYSSFLNSSYISTTGDTYYSLRSTRDSSSDTPTAAEYALFYTALSTNITQKPALIINYYEEPTEVVDDIIYYILPVDWDGTQEAASWQDEAPRLKRFILDHASSHPCA